MGRGGGGDYAQARRQREQQAQRKQRDKAERRMQQREQGRREPEIVSAEEVVGNLPSISDAMRAIEQSATAPRSVASIPCRLFVGGLGSDIREPELREAFSAFGVVADIIILKDRGTGESRGFGFVTLADRKDANRAVEQLHGSDLHGRRLVVNVATDRPR
jgi:RNA recognition motif. (a.k.a. RRM, RBD, or RNP domain)